MPQNFDPKAVIMALGAPPRRFGPEATKHLPRAGALGIMFVALAFGAMLLGAGLLIAGGSTSDRDNAPVVVFGGVLIASFASWQILKRRRIRARCEDLLRNGRAATGFVKSLASQEVQGVVTDRYEIEYQDATPKRHTLRSFWVSPATRFAQDSLIVVLHDPMAPERAVVFPLDFPDLKLQMPDVGQDPDPDRKMIEALAEAGAPLDFGESSAENALMGGLIKAGLYQGIKKLEEGDNKGAIESFDAVSHTAKRSAARPSVRAAIRA